MLLFNTEVSSVVSSQISTNPGLNFNPGSFTPLLKSLFTSSTQWQMGSVGGGVGKADKIF